MILFLFLYFNENYFKQFNNSLKDITIINCNFLNCISNSEGGSIYFNNLEKKIIIKYSNFYNSISSINHNGGGIYINSYYTLLSNLCFSSCKGHLGSSIFLLQNNTIINSNFFNSTGVRGISFLYGYFTNYNYNNNSNNIHSYQVALICSFCLYFTNFSFNNFINSIDSDGCSLVIHYSLNSIIDFCNIFNVSSIGTKTYSLLFFGHGSRVNFSNSFLFKNQQPLGFQTYMETGTQYFYIFNCIFNFPLSEFNSYPIYNSTNNIFATQLNLNLISTFNCLNIIISKNLKLKLFKLKFFINLNIY